MPAEPPPGRLALFEWGVSDRFGWGVYGLNLLLAWAGRTDLQPASLQPIDPAALDLDPLERHRLAPALARSALLQDGLRRLAGQRATSRHLLMEVVQNGLVPHGVPHGVLLRGSPSVGVAFLEDVRLDAGARERLRRYPLVVAGSGWNRDLLADAGAERVERVLQGVDPSRFHPAPRRALFPGRFVVLSGGKLEHRKGQDLVLRAFAAFAARRPDALLLALWSSPWCAHAPSLAQGTLPAPPLRADGRADVRAWAALAGVAAHQIIDLGAVPNRQLPPVLREADLGLFPSRAEGGTNLVAMECLACGVPALLSDNTGHRDLLALGAGLPLARQDPVPGPGHADWGESSVEEILAALQRAYDDPGGMRAHGARAAAAMATLSWRTQMEHLAALLAPLQA